MIILKDKYAQKLNIKLNSNVKYLSNGNIKIENKEIKNNFEHENLNTIKERKKNKQKCEMCENYTNNVFCDVCHDLVYHYEEYEKRTKMSYVKQYKNISNNVLQCQKCNIFADDAKIIYVDDFEVLICRKCYYDAELCTNKDNVLSSNLNETSLLIEEEIPLIRRSLKNNDTFKLRNNQIKVDELYLNNFVGSFHFSSKTKNYFKILTSI